MADPAWFIQGKWLEYCSCDYGCPCESMGNPTQGTCDGVVAMHIDEGYFGDVRLDNLNSGVLLIVAGLAAMTVRG